jgi:hypothetical protein
MGDANGDLKTDKADLAIVGGNFYLGENVDATHVLYGLARNYDGNWFPNSRIWLGDFWAGSVTQHVTGTSRDFWPALSPDGTRIAFIREVSGKYALFTIAASGTGTPTRLTPTNAWYDAFAPSWSPDGTKIAFICSWYNPENPDANDRGWPMNQGDACLIDANGRNQQVLTGGPNNHTQIYPPAWLGNTQLLFGGTSSNFNCPSTICLYDLQNRSQGPLDADIPVGADMPVYNGFGTIFYRFTSGPNRTLRMAEWNGDISAFGTTAPPVHVAVQYDTTNPQGDGTGLQSVSNDVDYYTIMDRNIVFYETSAYPFFTAYFNWEAPTPQWWGEFLGQHWVDDNAGNPGWSGNPNDPTDLFALRNTVDWTP